MKCVTNPSRRDDTRGDDTDDPTTMLTATERMINVTASVPRANVVTDVAR